MSLVSNNLRNKSGKHCLFLRTFIGCKLLSAFANGVMSRLIKSTHYNFFIILVIIMVNLNVDPCNWIKLHLIFILSVFLASFSCKIRNVPIANIVNESQVDSI